MTFENNQSLIIEYGLDQKPEVSFRKEMDKNENSVKTIYLNKNLSEEDIKN